MDLAQWAIDFLAQNPLLSIAIVFLIAMGEALLIVGLFVPSTVVLVGAGTLVGSGKLDFWPIFVATTVGAILGDAASYWAGRIYGQRLKLLWPLNHYPGLVQRTENFFTDHGGKSIAIGRFVPGVKAVIPGIAGMMGMSHPRFVTINVISAVAWSIAHLTPGILMGKGLALASEVSGRFAAVLLALFITVFVTAWLMRIAVMSAIPLLLSAQTRFVAYAAARPHPVWQWLAETLSPDNPRAIRVVLLSAVSTASIIGFISLFEDLVARDTLLNADVSIGNLVQSLRNTPADRVMAVVTMAGDGIVLGVLGAVIVAWLVWRRAWAIAGAASIAILSSALFVPFMKTVLQRPRPIDIYSGADAYSFPSGHATLATVVFGVLAVLVSLRLGRWGKALVFASFGALVVAIAFSRIYLGAHWPSDVAAGFLFGVAMTAAFALTLEATRIDTIAPLGLALVAGLAYSSVAVVHVVSGHAAALEFYGARQAVREISMSDWRSGGWAELPARRIELTGETEEPFVVQWVGTPEKLEAVLGAHGFKRVPSWSWTDVLTYADARNDIDVLLPRPSLHAGKLARLSMTRPVEGDDQARLVLRAWAAEVSVSGAPALLVALTEERKKKLPIVALPDDEQASPDDVATILNLLSASPEVTTVRPPSRRAKWRRCSRSPKRLRCLASARRVVRFLVAQRIDHLVQGDIELLDQLRADVVRDGVVDPFGFRRDAIEQVAALGRDGHDHAALVGLVGAAVDDAGGVELRQDARQARGMDAADLAQVEDLERFHFHQRADDAPLLVRQSVLVQMRPEPLHDFLTRPHELHRQRAPERAHARAGAGFGRVGNTVALSYIRGQWSAL
ncbi:bifunctional DedA family/phosphatase PAP2 family protein [Breoghania sp. L-A4]|uniref:bifunctional DedA family/phosphatase PAP2 family protein n=1 Tax=Breoghania sp. L-A4 TaxID=2304600 RepID=UPI0013C35F8C|nr:bifunctional DedA family/phosphatase PAP2 family protein [Breoghania sp. L-A4]